MISLNYSIIQYGLQIVEAANLNHAPDTVAE
jgi:hypothetical protein